MNKAEQDAGKVQSTDGEPMITNKRNIIGPILESSNGVHLSCYLTNDLDLIDLKRQIKNAIEEATEYLDPVMPAEEQLQFLAPLHSLLHDASILKKIKGNIGIFRSHNFFRVLNVPVETEPTCVVASSFHVKPLLKWAQSDRDFLIIGLEDQAVHFYLGSQNSLIKVDSFLFPAPLTIGRCVDQDDLSLRFSRSSLHQMMESINNLIHKIVGKSRPRLFIAGAEELTKTFLRIVRYSNTAKTPIADYFREQEISAITSNVRCYLQREQEQKLEQTFTEFRLAETLNLTRKNVFQIAKAVVEGRVRKLIVADEIKIFGKLDPNSGKLSLRPFDLDHEDDDILDDLAQKVLLQGGEVIVARRDLIPKRRPVLAILDYADPEEWKNELIDLSKGRDRMLLD